MDFRLADLQKFALIEPTRMLLELPAPEEDKADILFKENPEINPPDVINPPEGGCEYAEFSEQTILDLPKRKLLKEYDRGMAVLCPNKENAPRPITDCEPCKNYKGCPAYE